jgi:hypothetical protein
MWDLRYLKMSEEKRYIKLSPDYFNFLASLKMGSVDFNYADLSSRIIEIPSRHWPTGADLRGSTIILAEHFSRSADPRLDGAFQTFLRSQFDENSIFKPHLESSSEKPFLLGKGMTHQFDDFKECIKIWLEGGDVVQYLASTRLGTDFHGTSKTAWTGIQIVLGDLFLSGLAGEQRFYADAIQQLALEAYGDPHKSSLTPEEQRTYVQGVWLNTNRSWKLPDIEWQDHSQEIFPALPAQYFSDAFTQALTIIRMKDPVLYAEMIPEGLILNHLEMDKVL